MDSGGSTYTKVLVIGVFDLLHKGHLNLLKKAANLGKLTVGIVSDSAVKRQKGKSRPIQDELYRQELVSSLSCVYGTFIVNDFIFPEVEVNSHDIICVGADQQHFDMTYVPFEKHYILPRTPDVSTSDIVKKLKG